MSQQPPGVRRTFVGSSPTPRQLELLRALAVAKLPMSISVAGRLAAMAQDQASRALIALEVRGLVELMAHGGPRRVTDLGRAALNVTPEAEAS